MRSQKFAGEILKQEGLKDLYSFFYSFQNEHKIKIRIKRLKRAKRITLRVCQITGELRITIPPVLKATSLKSFILENLKWIKSQAHCLPETVHISEGIEIPLLGAERKILIDRACPKGYFLSSKILFISIKNADFFTQVKSALISIAKNYFTETCTQYSEKLGVSFSKISIRDTKSRWGSCSSEGKLMFSWRLIMAPRDVSSYVAAHEVAHLVHMNHGHNFWKVVKLLSPDYLSRRNWLKENGKKLYKFKF